MELKEYFQGLKDVSYCQFRIKEDKGIKLHLIAPVGKQYSLSWTLILEGRFYVRLNPEEGLLFYEFITELKKKGTPALTKNMLVEIGREIAIKITPFYPEIITDTLAERFSILTDEIVRFILGQKLKGKFKYLYPYTFSIRYKRPYGMRLTIDNFSKGEMHELLNHLENNRLISICYPQKFLDNLKFEDYLAYKNCFYNILETKGIGLNQKLLAKLKQSGLDEVVIPLYSIHPLEEYEISKNNVKDILSSIKASLKANLKVTVKTHITRENTDYLKLVQALHEYGVRSFKVSFDSDVDDKDIIVKRAYFYTNMNGLDLSLDTRGIIPESQLKRILLNPSYKEQYVSWYYIRDDFSLYLDEEMKYPVGNLSTMPLEECYSLKMAKEMRKETLKRKKYEKK